MYHYEIFWIQHSIPASSTAGFVTHGHKGFRPCLRAFPYAMIVVLLSDYAAILAGIGNELPDLPGQRVLHVADQHKTTIGRYFAHKKRL